MANKKINWWIVVVALIVGLLIGTFVLGNLFGAGVSLGPAVTGWTPWYDRDNPSGSGDWETLKELRQAHPEICATPSKIECQTTTGINYNQTGEIVICDVSKGAICINSQQPDGKCNYDYKVRFYCEGEINQTGNLNVTSNPSGVNIYVDNTLRGVTLGMIPIKISGLSVGNHAIKATKSGYNNYSTTKYIYAGDNFLHVNLTIITNETSAGCTDTDGGLNYCIKGTVYAWTSSVNSSNTDYCESNSTLREQYCNGTIGTESRVNCAGGCQNGACLC